MSALTYAGSQSAYLESRHISRAVDQLRPHPSLDRLQIVPSARHISDEIRERGQVFQEPVTVTRSRYILAGHAQWDMARREVLTNIPCLELDLTEDEALLWIIQKHRQAHSLNDFCRILLALELEPWFKTRALSNQQIGGRLKGSTNLADADKLDVRQEIANSAGVSAGNVSKVKLLVSAARPQLLEALRKGEISIHQAFLGCTVPRISSRCFTFTKIIRKLHGPFGRFYVDINSRLRGAMDS